MKKSLFTLLLITISALLAGPSIVGDMNGWNTADPLYDLNENANGVWELTKTISAGTYGYKVVDGDTWGDPNFPSSNLTLELLEDTEITWRVNFDDQFVTHFNPVAVGNFVSELGGTNWAPSDLTTEMTDADGDDIYVWQGLIPAGSWQGKVALNRNWEQNTGGNIGFTSDGVTETIISYNMANNETSIEAPAPPSAQITFIVDDSATQTYTGFFLKGTWITETGGYDIGWDNGAEHTPFYDDGTNGDETSGDHIWTAQQDLISDGGSNTWEWGINDSEHNWIDGNFQFSVVDDSPQTLTYEITGGTSQDVTVRFQLYMGNLDPSWYAGGVTIQGSEAPLDWDQSTELLTLDGDFYMVEIIFPAGTPYEVEYKFSRNDEARTWWYEEIDGNRTFTIEDFEPVQWLPEHYWNNEIPEPEVTIEMSGQQAVLNWPDIPGIFMYDVYRDEDPDGDFADKLNDLPIFGNSFTDPNTENEGKYFYKVIAVQ